MSKVMTQFIMFNRNRFFMKHCQIHLMKGNRLYQLLREDLCLMKLFLNNSTAKIIKILAKNCLTGKLYVSLCNLKANSQKIKLCIFVINPLKFLNKRLILFTYLIQWPQLEISTDSSTIYSISQIKQDVLQKRIIYFWAIMSITVSMDSK